jgi:cephalosporin-C deacetylase
VLGLLLTRCVFAQAYSPRPTTLEEVESFWQSTLDRVSREPLQAEVEPASDSLPYRKFRVTYRSLQGIKIRAYLAKPSQQATNGKRLPAIVTAPGYGGTAQGIMLDECQRGYVILQVYPRSQGESAELWKIDGPDKLTWRIEQPEGYYYQGAYVDVIRGVDYLVSLPEVDSARIGIMGTSQSGGIALAVAALDSRIKGVVAHVPFLCAMRGAAAIPGSLVQQLLEKHQALSARNLRTLDFFDPLTLAPLLRAPVLMSAGGKDLTCPPETIRAVFGRLSGTKALVLYPNLPHANSVDFYQMSWEWMNRHLAR